MNRYLLLAIAFISLSVFIAGNDLALGQECTTKADCEAIPELVCLEVFCNEFGFCQNMGPLNCNTPPNECHNPFGECNLDNGQCEYTPTGGGECDDGNACTSQDFCMDGVCTGGLPTFCEQSDQCHEIGTCNPDTGLCSNPEKEDNTACDDGNACTQVDHCISGVCAGSPVTNGTGCNDSNACTQMDTCQNGVCSGGSPVTNGTACDDNNACTQMDACQNGACMPGSSVVCTALDQCHDAGTCNTMTGMCSNPAKANGTPCDNDTICDGIETCQGESCTSGAELNCNDENACTTEMCDPVDGCEYEQISGCCTSDTQCADENECTANERCVANVCTSDPVTCDDEDSCTDDDCQPEIGCTFTANWMTRCNDANPCTDDSCISETGDCDHQFNLCGSVIDTACPCNGPWKNHGKYVSCVAHQVNSLQQVGYITEEQGEEIVSQAAQSNCGF